MRRNLIGSVVQKSAPLSSLAIACRWATITPLAMPALSPTMETGKIAEWVAKVGDEIASGDTWCKVETDKASVSFDNVSEEGFLARIIAEPGQMITVGQPIALLVDEKADIESDDVKNWKAPAAAEPAPEPKKEETAAPANTPSSSSSPPSSAAPADIHSSGPAVVRLAQQVPQDALSKLKPSGKNGRLTKADFVAGGIDINYENGKALSQSSSEKPSFSDGSSSTAASQSSVASFSTVGAVNPGQVYNWKLRDDAILARLIGKKTLQSKAPAKVVETVSA